MKIVIVGAGIAGCAAYLELRKHLQAENNITIYEAYSTAVEGTVSPLEDDPTRSATLLVGGGLGVGPNGLNVLRRLDKSLLQDIVRGAYVVSHGNLKDKTGKVLVRLDNNLPREDDETITFEVGSSRHSLWKCLRARIPDDHVVTKRVSDVVISPHGFNLVKFADGSQDVQADIVIGADGLHSVVKCALYGGASSDPYPARYEGLVGVGGFLPAADLRDVVEKGSMNFVLGGNGFFGYFFSESAPTEPDRDSPYKISDPGSSLAWWSTYAVDECPAHGTLDMRDVTKQLRERHADWEDPVVQKVIESVDVKSMYPTWTVPPLPSWGRHGVVLVGDAAHALPSTSGQGSSQAMEDCEALAMLLSHQQLHLLPDDAVSKRKQAIAAAVERYQAIRKSRVSTILAAAQKIQNSKRDMARWQEFAMYSMLRVLGFFPSLAARSMRQIREYNVADEVTRVMAEEKLVS